MSAVGTGAMAGILVLGKVCNIHLHPDIVKNGQVDRVSLDAIGWLGGYVLNRERLV